MFASVGYTLLAVGFAGLLACSLSARPSLFHATLRSPLLQWFGKYSYGLYLYHMLILGLIEWWCPAATLADGTPAEVDRFRPLGGSILIDAPLRTAIVLVATCLIAWLSYHALELPFLKLKSFYASNETPSDEALEVQVARHVSC